MSETRENPFASPERVAEDGKPRVEGKPLTEAEFVRAVQWTALGLRRLRGCVIWLAACAVLVLVAGAASWLSGAWRDFVGLAVWMPWVLAPPAIFLFLKGMYGCSQCPAVLVPKASDEMLGCLILAALGIPMMLVGAAVHFHVIIFLMGAGLCAAGQFLFTRFVVRLAQHTRDERILGLSRALQFVSRFMPVFCCLFIPVLGVQTALFSGGFAAVKWNSLVYMNVTICATMDVLMYGCMSFEFLKRMAAWLKTLAADDAAVMQWILDSEQ